MLYYNINIHNVVLNTNQELLLLSTTVVLCLDMKNLFEMRTNALLQVLKFTEYTSTVIKKTLSQQKDQLRREEKDCSVKNNTPSSDYCL